VVERRMIIECVVYSLWTTAVAPWPHLLPRGSGWGKADSHDDAVVIAFGRMWLAKPLHVVPLVVGTDTAAEVVIGSQTAWCLLHCFLQRCSCTVIRLSDESQASPTNAHSLFKNVMQTMRRTLCGPVRSP
jgi:hypothetical protein